MDLETAAKKDLKRCRRKSGEETELPPGTEEFWEAEQSGADREQAAALKIYTPRRRRLFISSDAAQDCSFTVSAATSEQ